MPDGMGSFFLVKIFVGFIHIKIVKQISRKGGKTMYYQMSMPYITLYT